MIKINDLTNEDLEHFKSSIKAPFVRCSISTLGGKEQASLMIVISLDSRENWAYGIIENSKHSHFHWEHTGVLEQFSKDYKIEIKFRKTKAEKLDQVIEKINKYIEKIS